MRDETLAVYANYTLGAAVLVLTAAMLCFALYLAQAAPARDRRVQRLRDRDRVLVGSGGAEEGTPPSSSGDLSLDDDASSATSSAASGPSQTPSRAQAAAGIARSLTWLGAGLLLASIVLRGVAVHRVPLGNLFEFSVVGAFFTVAVYAVAGLRRELRWLGVFVTAFVVLLLFVASSAWYVEADELVPSLNSYWLPIHVSIATLSVGIFAVAAIVSALYLLSERKGSSGFWAKLPAADQLERFSYGLHVIAFPLWTFTLIFGAIWARDAWGAYWNWDPKEVWTFVIWTVYAAYLHARATKNTSRRTTNWIALAGFACIVINYTVVNFYFIGQHSYAQ